VHSTCVLDQFTPQDNTIFFYAVLYRHGTLPRATTPSVVCVIAAGVMDDLEKPRVMFTGNSPRVVLPFYRSSVLFSFDMPALAAYWFDAYHTRQAARHRDDITYHASQKKGALRGRALNSAFS